MKWIPISEIDKYDITTPIIIWQKNLSDDVYSKFQRATYYKGSHIRIYPSVYGNTYKKSTNYKGYDLEGDECQITHFAFVSVPSK